MEKICQLNVHMLVDVKGTEARVRKKIGFHTCRGVLEAIDYMFCERKMARKQ